MYCDHTSCDCDYPTHIISEKFRYQENPLDHLNSLIANLQNCSVLNVRNDISQH